MSLQAAAAGQIMCLLLISIHAMVRELLHKQSGSSLRREGFLKHGAAVD
jgi:hypothetical protein